MNFIKNRTSIAAILGTLALSTASLASGTGFQVIYNGGSIQSLKPGTAVSFRVDGRQMHVVEGDTEVATIPTYAISGISYKDDATTHRGDALNVSATTVSDTDAPSMYARSNHRSVIVTWAEGERKGGFALQCEPAECPLVLAALQGVSGKQALDLDVPAIR